MERKQFTFYKSFYTAIRRFKRKSDRCDAYEAMFEYVFFGVMPELEKLSPGVASNFELIQPTLDAGRKKAENGIIGGRIKPTESKPKANRKQTGSKTEANGKQDGSEKEVEIENEIEKENEIEIEGEEEKEKEQPTPHDGKLFTAFWEEYPDKCNRDAAWEAWKQVNPDTQLAGQIMASLRAWKKSAQWLDQNGKFIPRAAKWLTEGHWQNVPSPLQRKKEETIYGCGTLGKAEMEFIRRALSNENGEGEA